MANTSVARVVLAACLSLTAAGPLHAGPIQDANAKTVVDFYRLAFMDHQPKAAAEKYIGPMYVQHNPGAPNGSAAFVGFVEGLQKQFPASSVDIAHVLADRDLVAIHSHVRLDAQDPGKAVVDLFRVADGKIVEHWDVIEDVPASTMNGNTMFDDGISK